MKSFCLFAALLALAACSKSPELQPPVDLQPGLYEVTVGGGTMVELRQGGRSAAICFAADNAAAFPTDPLTHIIESWPDCSSDQAHPKGNALQGQRSCPDRKTPVLLTYSGSHTTDSFRLEGTVSQGSDEGGGVMRLGSGDFTITGKRLGPCEG